jgi:hypothetical protein
MEEMLRPIRTSDCNCSMGRFSCRQRRTIARSIWRSTLLARNLHVRRQSQMKEERRAYGSKRREQLP